jgi:hypothetical protein
MQNLLSSRLLSKNVKIRIYKTIILPVVWCGCETWSLTLREEHRLRVFENSVLRRIFGPKRNEVKEEIKSRRMRWGGHVGRMEEKRNTCMLLVGKPEGKRPLGKPRCKWVDNIQVIMENRIGWYGLDWSVSG